jgi:hypothetical protein
MNGINTVKTNHTLHILVAALGLLLMQLLYPSAGNCASPDSTGGGPTNALTRSASTNIVNEAGSLYKTIVDRDSGQYAVVDTNKEAVTLKDSADRVIIWSLNVVDGLKTNRNPRVSGRKIEGMDVYKGDLWVDVGRGYAVIDVKTGKLKGTASN